MLDPGFTTMEMASVFTRRIGSTPWRDSRRLSSSPLRTLVWFRQTMHWRWPRHARSRSSDPDAVLAATWSEGTPLRPLLDQIRGRLPEKYGRWVHYGATSQDTIDTSAMLQADAALGILDSALVSVARAMVGLIRRHRDQPQMGRTFLQHARPTTFGMRVAGWVLPTLDHMTELREMRSGLVVQLGGPGGNLAAFGDAGVAVAEALSPTASSSPHPPSNT